MNCGLIICDEAHKLKNSQSQVAVALSQMPARRRILLTGTPIQNDLEEFFVICDLVRIVCCGEPYASSMLIVAQDAPVGIVEHEILSIWQSYE